MGGIRMMCSSIVQAAHPNPDSKRIELSPWDLQFLPLSYTQRGILFYMPELKDFDEQSEYVLSLVNNLKASLSKALDHFPPLAGRLATVDHHDNDDTVSFYIDCNNAGALFVHAAFVDEVVTVADINQPVYVPSVVDPLFQLNGVKNHHGTLKPLLAIQVTKLVDGIFLAISMNHVVMDGLPFVHFLNYWMEMTKSSSSSNKYLSDQFQRDWFLNYNSTAHFPVRIPRSCIKQFDDEDDELAPCTDPSSNSHLKVKMFHFSKEAIAKLKEKANVEVLHVGNNININGEISSLQALLSHIWRSIIRNDQNMDPDEGTTLHLAIDARQRLKDLPKLYLGNAIQIATVTMKAKELLGLEVDNGVGIGKAALEMNRTIASYDHKKIRHCLECWTKCPQIKKATSLAGRNVIAVAGSPRFNVYRVESGILGRIVGARTGPARLCEGRILVVGGAEEGSIDLEVCFSIPTIQSLENDQQFMDYVSTPPSLSLN